MVDAKEAVAGAAAFLGSLFDSAREVRLEEISLSSTATTWQVVLSFRGSDNGSLPPLPVPGNLSNSGNRQFKQIDIDRMSGEARALRAWKA